MSDLARTCRLCANSREHWSILVVLDSKNFQRELVLCEVCRQALKDALMKPANAPFTALKSRNRKESAK